MRNLGTFFGVIAMALAASVSVNDQQEPVAIPEVRASNLTDTGTNSPGIDKGFWDWITGLVGNVPSFGGLTPGSGSTSTSTSPAPDVGPAQFPRDCQTCKCGLTNKNNRIVGGMETQENQYPWMTLLLYQDRFYCGGTVISSRHILTAAHCVEGFDKAMLKARLLVHDRDSNSVTRTKDYRIQQVIRHGGYSTINYNNDIALLKVIGVIKFEGSLRPVCLPEFTKTFAGENGIVTGWGATGESGPLATRLQEVTVPILSNTECRATKYPARRITDNMLCAGFREGGKDSCQGDSGGPLHVVHDSIHSIVGVVSWGEGCAAKNYPGVYTRVNRFLTWIQHNTQDACYC